MELTPQDIDHITQLTLRHYDSTAEQFFAGTIDHDVSQNISALLGAITGTAPYRLLDLGCGPGRDLKTLRALGHQATGIDGSARFVEMARAHSGCDVWQQDFVHPIYRRTPSTASTPTPRCSTCRAWRCRR